MFYQFSYSLFYRMSLKLYIFLYTIQLRVINADVATQRQDILTESRLELCVKKGIPNIYDKETHTFTNSCVSESTPITADKLSKLDLQNVEYNIHLLIYYFFHKYKFAKIHKKTFIPTRNIALQAFQLNFKDFKFINFDKLKYRDCILTLAHNEAVFNSNQKLYSAKFEEFLNKHISPDFGYTKISEEVNTIIESNDTLKRIDFQGNKNFEAFTQTMFLKWYNMFNYVTTNNEGNSLMPLIYPFMIPGEQFNEMYYWDTYFQIDTLLEFRLFEFIFNLLNNFINLLDNNPFIPNATRTYFDRSQPPVFGLIIDKVFSSKKQIYFSDKLTNLKEKCISSLEKEYRFWKKYRTIVVDGLELNVYRNNSNKPRLEQIGKDFQMYLEYQSSDIFNEIKAATESGWDFSSRWETTKNKKLTIKTSKYIPVDLNSILYRTEKILFKYTSNGYYRENYERRKIAMEKLLKVQTEDGFVYYTDYNYEFGTLNTEYFYFSNIFYFIFVEPCKQKLLPFITQMGIYTSRGITASNNNRSMHQWDYTIWAFFQQLVAQYLYSIENNKKDSIKVAITFIKTVYSEYKIDQTIYENYSPYNVGPSLKGEYKTSRGFAWTHSTILYLILKYNTEEEFKNIFK